MSQYFNPEVHQLFDDTCAIKSQQLILNDFGIEITEPDLVQVAAANGWYNGGTAPQDVGKLLELAGVPVTRQEGANVFNLVNELAHGHEIIVGLDSNELWYNDSVSDKFRNWLDDFFGSQGGNHALIVAGIDTTDPSDVKVIVKDTGSGDDGKPYPLSQFMDAWSDANCYMVSTDVPAPGYSVGMSNFDYEVGHIPEVAGVDFTDFQIFNDISMGLPPFVTTDMGGFFSPISSLTDAYFDYAADSIDFNGIFSNDYQFNDWLDCNLVNDYLRSTCFDGLNAINWQDITPMGFDTSGIGMSGFDRTAFAGLGLDYGDFYNDCIGRFNAIGDFYSADLCQQQLNIMDYCQNNDLDYMTDFLDC